MDYFDVAMVMLMLVGGHDILWLSKVMPLFSILMVCCFVVGMFFGVEST